MNLIKKITTLPEKQKDLILLVLRITVGIVFIQAGWGKFQNFDKVVGYFSSMGIPFAQVNVVLAAGTELIGGLLILLGIWVRFAIWPLAFVMLVATFTAHLSDITGITAFLGLSTWTYFLTFFILGAFGAGKYKVKGLPGD